MRIAKYEFGNFQYLFDVFDNSELATVRRKSLSFPGHDLGATISQSALSQF